MTTISVILPVLNESANLPATLRAIAAAGAASSVLSDLAVSNIEIIVVDGGSQDNSVQIAQQLGAIAMTAQPGRASQMNAGAAIAQGQILLFLHADTQLPTDFPMLVTQTLALPQVVAGAFDLRIDGQGWGLRWIEWGVFWRSRLCQLPYGDQALFLTAATFHQLSGFPDQPLMEDFVFVKRLQRLGKIAIAPAAVHTSARRWQYLGIFQTTAINQLMLLGYYLGISPARLAAWYRRRK